MTDLLCVVVGCGGIGYHLAPHLARFTVNDKGFDNVGFMLVDADRIEQKNLERVYGKGSVGLFKTAALANILLQQEEKLAGKVVSYPKFLRADLETLGNIEKATDALNLHNPQIALFGCVDNNASRLEMEKIAESLAEANRTCIYIDAGNDFNSGQVRAWDGKDDGRFGLRPSKSFPDLTNLEDVQDRHPDDVSCTEQYESDPQLSLTNAQAALTAVCVFRNASTRTAEYVAKQSTFNIDHTRVVSKYI